MDVNGYGKTFPGRVWISSSFLEKAYSSFFFSFFPRLNGLSLPNTPLNLVYFKPPFRNRGETSFDSNSLYIELLS